jgi:hypothetical protein
MRVRPLPASLCPTAPARRPRLTRLAATALLTLATPAASQAIRGTVSEDSSHAPVPAAELWLLAGGKRVGHASLSGDDGQFYLQVPRPGRYAVSARRLGFEPKVTAPIDVERKEELQLEITLAPLPAVLRPELIAASGLPRPTWLDGFEHRRLLGLGVFFTREDLVRRGEPRLPELLRGIAGVNLASDRRRTSPTMMRSAYARRCFAVLYLDGFRMSHSDDPPEVVRTAFESVPGPTLEAVEVYKGRSELPGEFGGPDARCGAVVAWTRRGPDAGAPPSPQPPARPTARSAPTPTLSSQSGHSPA